MKTFKRITGKILKWLGIVLLTIITLLIIILIVIRTEWGQNKIVNYATSYVSDKTGTVVEIDRLFVTFDGNIQLEGLYLEDQNQDTLLYSKSLEAGLAFRSLVDGDINISTIDWEGLTANIVYRRDSTFNFSFLMDALVPVSDSTSTSPTDTSTSPQPNISLGPVSLTNFEIAYLDSISGLKADLDLNSLELSTDDLDLENFRFELDDIVLNGLNAKILQFASPPASQDSTTSTPMPFIAFNTILLENINLDYQTLPDTLSAKIDLGKFEIGESEIDLNDQVISIANIELLDSQFNILLPEPKPSVIARSESPSTGSEFQWPAWEVEVGTIEMDGNNIIFNQGKGTPKHHVFDPMHLGIRGLKLDINGVLLKDDIAQLEVTELAFTERSGFTLKEFATEVELTDEKLEIDHLRLITNNSRVNSAARITYTSLEAMLADPGALQKVNLQVENTLISISDAYYFNDSLRYDPSLQNIGKYPIGINADVSGLVDDIDIKTLTVNGLNNTRLSLFGTITGYPDTNALRVNIPNLKFNTTREDMKLLAGNTLPENFPAEVKISSSLRGGVENLKAKLEASTTEGSLSFSGQVGDLLEIPYYKGALQIVNLNVSAFTGNQQLENVSMNMDFDGRGITIEDLEFESKINFKKLNFNNYDYRNLKVEAGVENHEALLKIGHTDNNLDFDLTANAKLDSINTIAEFDLDLRGADLHDLNFNSRKIKLALDVKGSFQGNAEDFDSKIYLSQATVVRKDRSYRVDTVFAELENSTEKTKLIIQSPVLAGQLNANTSLQTTFASLNGYLKGALGTDSAEIDTAYNKLDVQANFVITDSPLLSDVLTPKLSQLDSIRLNFNFQPANEIFKIDVVSPKIIYAGIELENLKVNVDAGRDSLLAALGFDYLKSGPVEMHTTRFNADITNGQGYAQAQVFDVENTEVFYTALDISRFENYVNIKVDPQHLVFNRNEWNIPEANIIEIEDGGIHFEEFILSRNDQKIHLQSYDDKDLLSAEFNNFRLITLFSILNPDESPVQGSLNGKIELINLQKSPVFIADLNLNDLALLGNPVGQLTLDANNRQSNIYEMLMTLKGEQVDLKVEGNYSLVAEKAQANLQMDLKKLEMTLVQAFSKGQLENSSGFITGSVSITGPVEDIAYEGRLGFNNARLTPTMLGTSFRLNNDKIKINNDRVIFDKFSLEDARGNITTIDGRIITENILVPGFDLRIKAQEFTFLNSDGEDNELYYGKAVANLDLKVTGDLDLPVVDAKFKLLQGSNITYAVPLAQARIVERRGIVRFRNMKDSTDVFSEEETSTAAITGIDVTALLEVDPGTRFNIIVDPQTGDVLTVMGEANLNLDISPNGNMDLVGSYEISDGSYNLSLYELVKKEFNILRGSRVEWRGDPMEAILDITAIYKLETAPTDLMADQLAGADASTLNQYKQDIPFEVLLYIDGNLSQPEISFGLEIPDANKGALGGSVYSRVQQLNENESELNKQVFSLIVFNRFLPSNIASDNGGGTSQLARSSVSKLLSNQLNKLSEQYVKGIELNFDVESYTDYQSGDPEQRTDLNVSLKKTLADGRVIIQVGTSVGIEGQEQSSNFIGDVQAEYLITENGVYRLQLFRKNQFQDIVEGQVVITGLAILFNKEFNTWEQLWKKQEKEPNEEPELKLEKPDEATEDEE